MNVSTNFLNSKMRRIFVSAAGKYFAKSDDGKRTYKPKAAFRKVGANGSMNKLKKSNTVPTPIRPSMIAGRKMRKNAGGMRMTEAKAYQMIFPGNSAMKKTRKVRKNAGVARGPREGKLLRQMAAQSNRLIAARKRKASKKNAKSALKKLANFNPFSVFAGKKA